MVAMSRSAKQDIIALLAFTSLLGVANSLHAQGTAFTYQGRLQDGTNHASGTYDFTFRIWSNASGPAQVGSTVTNIATGVTNGLFAVTMDFGGGVFDGNPRWLEIGVRTNGGGVFTTLLPRQALTAAPYAIHAGSVNAAGISGAITPSMLSPGAAAANLAAGGQGTVPSGGVVFSASDNDINLTAAGYVRSGGFVNAQNLWRERAASPVLAARRGHAAAWTGGKMIVWGGNCGNDNPNVPPPKIRFTDGGSYDPVANTWSALASNGAPAGREECTWVWTGTEMIIWGGYFYDGSYHYFNDGARYNLGLNNWAAVTTNGAPTPRYRHTAIWTGTEMIVWGGVSSDGGGFQLNLFNDGYRFNPASNAWTRMNTNGAPAARTKHTAVWTGTEMIIWGGQGGSGLTVYLNDGARYNSATDTWSPVSSTNAPLARSGHTAVWSGSDMIVWGGFSGGGPYQETGARYNPATDSWLPTDYAIAPSGRVGHTAVWTGREMIIWGGDKGSSYANDGGSYDPTSNIWTPMTTTPRAPAGRANHTAVWTGSEMIVFGGFSDAGCVGDTWSCAPPKLLYLYLKP